ncbi:aspartic proteinase nepenthesin-2-like [Castanea sativa]|uniref:aspartic proteinase nepenthesin-2-like n=1 Tax=Castanea sativa TaxID=21020 RepID=UPI003F64AC3A
MEGDSRVSLDTDDVRSSVIAETKHQGFMANISIGSPPIPQLLIMDTGSSVSWTQCQAPYTHCFTQALPIFNPPQSATYRLLPCSSPICHQAPSMICLASRCEYELRYGDGTIVSGYLGTEKMTFETSYEGITSVPNLVFGCATNVGGNLGSLGGQTSGVLGLGAKMTSLVNQLGSKFSYCFGPTWDLQYSHNQLIVGDGAVIEGPSTPITIFGSYYYVTLDSFTTTISPQVFKVTKQGTGGVVIDSGATLTYLPKAAYDPLKDEVLSLMDDLVLFFSLPSNMSERSIHVPASGGVIDRDLVGFPVVTFTFANGVDLALDVKSFFAPAGPHKFCMAVAPGTAANLTLIIVLAQQSYNIAYDLPRNMHGFHTAD